MSVGVPASTFRINTPVDRSPLLETPTSPLRAWLTLVRLSVRRQARMRQMVWIAVGLMALTVLFVGLNTYFGRWTYTDDKRRAEKEKCEVVTTQINVAPPPPPPPARQQARSPSSFPKESPAERATAKGRQREILEKELAAEEQDLAKAKQALAEQESVRTGEERNYAKVLHNPSSLPHDYAANLALTLGIVWTVALGGAVATAVVRSVRARQLRRRRLPA